MKLQNRAAIKHLGHIWLSPRSLKACFQADFKSNFMVFKISW